MRKLVLFVLFAMINISVFAINEKPTKQEIRTTIVKLLGKTDFKIKKELKTTVEFIINKKGELVILDITCSNPLICEFIKNKLNYKKVHSNSTDVQFFKMPLRILKS
ncbi:hypothetical protein SAMN04489761_2695 [Tenacibaculum sp. MAR_2009_124]|uniref:hypothetical protein n=1 Tax=Tenacibaculum sp. MAR_2009_124 TaxID=1250059 RepID=UPI00089B6724|nr:hypothetical protein [Tenacibaculum sp. MAR_2009_124]SEC33060.1 hypothetical protein SAMN04489761_2695 [Tenacibaculum sp. MAR_2009_124]